MGSLPLNQNEPDTSSTEDGIGNAWKNTNTKLAKKVSRFARFLRDDKDFTSFKHD